MVIHTDLLSLVTEIFRTYGSYNIRYAFLIILVTAFYAPAIHCNTTCLLGKLTTKMISERTDLQNFVGEHAPNPLVLACYTCMCALHTIMSTSLVYACILTL